jgi:hypothetical protein
LGNIPEVFLSERKPMALGPAGSGGVEALEGCEAAEETSTLQGDGEERLFGEARIWAAGAVG